jgi:tetratricopeptide (TPR) repeat protein
MASSRKYMVRNAKGKEFGPYTKDQVLGFYKDKKLKASTNLRLVDGTGVATVQDLLQQEESAENKTSVVRLDKLSKMRDQIEKKKAAEKERIEQERVKEEFKKELESEKFEEFKFNTEKEVEEEVDYEEIDNKIVEENLDKTVIKRPVIQAEVEATIVVKPEGALTDQENEDLDEMLQGSGTFTIEGEEEEEDEISGDEATRVLDIANIDAGVRLEAKNSEREAQDEIRKYEKQLRDAENQYIDDPEEDEEDEEEEESNTKKKIGPIFAVLFLAVAYMFMSDDDKKKFEPPKYFKVKNIAYQQVADPTKASQLYDKAVAFYLKGTYKTKLMATGALRQSISFDAKNDKAKDLLIYLYSELMENARDQQQTNKFIYSMIRMNRSRIAKSHFLAAGTARFFLKIGNPQAAYNTVWNYIQLYIREKLDAEANGVEFNRKQWPIVWATYLETQVALDLMGPEEAEKTFNSLNKIPRKSLELYRSLLVYLKAKNKDNDYFEMLQKARKNYPGSVFLLMKYTDFLFLHGDLHTAMKEKEGKKQFKSYLKAIDEMTFLNFEGSPFYYARLLEHKAMSYGLVGDQRKAIAYIKKSLRILESKDLRAKLSKFELMEKDGKGTEVILNTVVNESKVLKAIEESQDALKAKDYEKAILGAIKATAVLPNDNRARLNLARVQISRGYFELGLKTLEEIAADNILSLDIQVELIRGYVKAKKIKEAELHIAKLLKTDKLDFALTWQYPSLVGRIYNKKENLGMAINKLQDSINRNPLNADDLYLLSEIFLNFRKYKRCKYYLGQAMELDPDNIDYHILYAKTIYELQDANTAIGYLKRRLEEYPNNPRVMGAIANYYYLAGFNKEFEMYRNKLRLNEKQDKYIYDFLVKASVQDEKWENVIDYAKKLIIIDPSDLEAYMLLGENLYNRSRFDEALRVFDQVEERLSSYKKLHYFKAKIYISKRNYEEAIKESDKEIEANPAESYGYTSKGMAYIKLERYPEAIRSLKMAISRNGKDIEGLMSLADVRYKQLKFDEARELYSRVKRYDPNNPLLYRQLGHIFRKIGQPGLAIENYKVYLDQNPAARDRSQVEGIIQAIQ